MIIDHLDLTIMVDMDMEINIEDSMDMEDIVHMVIVHILVIIILEHLVDTVVMLKVGES